MTLKKTTINAVRLNRWALDLILGTWVPLLIVFSGFRLAFLWLYWDLFGNAALGEILIGLLHGVRFDAAVILTLTGIPATIFFLVSPSRWRALAFWVYFSLVAMTGAGMVLLLAVDLGYYEFVGRRVSFEVFEMLDDWRPVTRMMFLGFPIRTAIVVLVLGVMGWAFRRRLSLTAAKPWRRVHPFGNLLQGLLLFLVIVVLARGGIQRKPLSVSVAFSSDHLITGHLTLNPVFTVYRQAVRRGQPLLKFMADQDAIAHTRALMGLGKAPKNPDFPMLQERPGRPPDLPPAQPKNLVVIVLESFSAQYLTALGGEGEMTPNLDALAREGLLFSNFYAVGTRSLEGIGTLLTGYPNLPNVTLIGSQLEQNTLISLPILLKRNGYKSLFLHGAFRGSMRFDAFAARNGFDRFIAQEDFPDYESISDSYWGIFDHYALERLHQELKSASRPTFAFFFSLSSHTPFELPDDQFRTFPPDSPNAGLRNAVAYTDKALGMFFEKARKSAYWRNTVFLITADHNLGKNVEGGREKMQIPLVILAPGDPDFPSGEVRGWLGGQMDVAPTVLDLLDLPGRHSFAGRSLMRLAPGRFAPFGWGSQAGWLDDQGLLVHNLTRPIGYFDWRQDPTIRHNLLGSGGGREAAAITNLEAFLQTWNNLLIRNRLAPTSP